MEEPIQIQKITKTCSENLPRAFKDPVFTAVPAPGFEACFDTPNADTVNRFIREAMKYRDDVEAVRKACEKQKDDKP